MLRQFAPGWVLRGASFPFVAQHGAQLLPQFGRFAVPVSIDGMLYGDIEHFLRVSGNGDVAGFFRWKPAAIDYFASFCHNLTPW